MLIFSPLSLFADDEPLRFKKNPSVYRSGTRQAVRLSGGFSYEFESTDKYRTRSEFAGNVAFDFVTANNTAFRLPVTIRKNYLLVTLGISSRFGDFSQTRNADEFYVYNGLGLAIFGELGGRFSNRFLTYHFSVGFLPRISKSFSWEIALDVPVYLLITTSYRTGPFVTLSARTGLAVWL